MPENLEWEKISDKSGGFFQNPWYFRRLYRMAVFGGWLVKEEEYDTQPIMAFVPDPNHEWKIDKETN